MWLALAEALLLAWRDSECRSVCSPDSVVSRLALPAQVLLAGYY